MRISIIVHGRFHAFDLAREFERLGYLHQLITTYPRSVTAQFGVPTRKVSSLIGYEIVRRGFSKLIINQHFNNYIETLISKAFAWQAAKLLNPCDVIIAWSSVGSPSFKKASSWGALCVCERGSSHILTQEQLLKEEYQAQELPWAEWTDSKVKLELDDYKNSQIITLPSQFAKDSFIQHGFSEDRLVHVPYGVSLSNFQSTSLDVNLPFRVLFVGSLSLRKGVGYLEEAFLKSDLPNSELWFVGPTTNETNTILKSHDSRISILGPFPQGELVKVYNQSTVFVIPSIEEGLAMVQAQALACGLPLICTTNTGGEDLLRLSKAEPTLIDMDIRQYPAGFVVPIRRPDKIAFCLQLLYNKPHLLTSMREEATKIHKSQLDWSFRANELATIYSSLMSDTKPP